MNTSIDQGMNFDDDVSRLIDVTRINIARQQKLETGPADFDSQSEHLGQKDPAEQRCLKPFKEVPKNEVDNHPQPMKARRSAIELDASMFKIRTKVQHAQIEHRNIEVEWVEPSGEVGRWVSS